MQDQRGPVRGNTQGVSSLVETSELWALAHHQLFIKGFKWSHSTVCPEMPQSVGG